jgi:hypothetical protein
MEADGVADPDVDVGRAVFAEEDCDGDPGRPALVVDHEVRGEAHERCGLILKATKPADVVPVGTEPGKDERRGLTLEATKQAAVVNVDARLRDSEDHRLAR